MYLKHINPPSTYYRWLDRNLRENPSFIRFNFLVYFYFVKLYEDKSDKISNQEQQCATSNLSLRKRCFFQFGNNENDDDLATKL